MRPPPRSGPAARRLAALLPARRVRPRVRPEAGADGVWVLHASSSMAASVLIQCVILLGALVCPVVPPFPPWAPLMGYPVQLAVARAAAMWLARRRLAPPPSPRSGAARPTLAVLSAVLIFLSPDPELVRLGFWTAWAALAAGALADGELLAVISLRRNLGLLRTLTAVDRLQRTAVREAWSEVMGRTP